MLYKMKNLAVPSSGKFRYYISYLENYGRQDQKFKEWFFFSIQCYYNSLLLQMQCYFNSMLFPFTATTHYYYTCAVKYSIGIQILIFQVICISVRRNLHNMFLQNLIARFNIPFMSFYIHFIYIVPFSSTGDSIHSSTPI